MAPPSPWLPARCGAIPAFRFSRDREAVESSWAAGWVAQGRSPVGVRRGCRRSCSIARMGPVTHALVGVAPTSRPCQTPASQPVPPPAKHR